jgi:hypothetical protein
LYYLLNSMVDKDAKVREMRRENQLLTSKIQLLEDQMENLNERVDRTLRERNQLRREVNSVRFDSNLSIEVIFYFFKTPKKLSIKSFLDKFSFFSKRFSNKRDNLCRINDMESSNSSHRIIWF